MNRIDKGEIYKWFNLFVGWKEDPLVEIRIIGHGRTASGYFTDPDSIAEWIERYDTDNIYFTVNSVSSGSKGRAQFQKIIERPSSTTTDKEISSREWAFIDIDVDRIKDTNATEEETEYAKAVGRRVVRFLKEQGFSQPIVTFSGNGIHIYFRCQMLNTDANTKTIQGFVEALGMMFNDERIKIDPVIYNASRIARLPGTMSGKGRIDDSERPQRMCRILSFPQEVRINDNAYFEKIASLIPEPPKPSRENDWGRESFDLQSFIRKHGIAVKQEVRAAGGTRYILDHCVFDQNHKAKDAMIFQYDNGAIVYKCLHASCSQYKWRDVRLLYEPDAYNTREEVSDFAYKRRMQGVERKPFTPVDESPEKGPVWLSLDEVPTLDPDSIESIATGIKELDKKMFGGTILQQLSIMTGRPASGKSTILNTILLSSVQQGYPTALFSGELPDWMLKSWITLPAAGRNYVKPSLKRNDSWYVPKEVESKILQWLKGKLYIHNAEYGDNWGQLRKDILDIIKKGAKNIILDNLMTIGLDDSEWDKNKAQIGFIHELHDMVRQENVHIWLVAHPRKQSAFLRFEDISGASEIGNFADNVCIVHRINQDFENQAKAFFPKHKLEAIKDAGYTNVVEIAKNRVPGLYIGDLVGVFYEPETKRMKNNPVEMFQYGWDSTPVQQELPMTTDNYWYDKEQDNELEF